MSRKASSTKSKSTKKTARPKSKPHKATGAPRPKFGKPEKTLGDTARWVARHKKHGVLRREVVQPDTGTTRRRLIILVCDCKSRHTFAD